jgi:alpha-D-xyloside xylohydrolase
VSVVEEFRKRDIPLDNIVLDWQYWEPDKWGSHEFDHSRFPDPEGMIDKLHNDLNTRIMISVWPKYYQGIGHYKEMDVKGYLYKRLIKQQVRDWLGYVATFYDAFNPGARDLFWEQINEHLYSKGIDAWWLDATEPDLRSNSSILERKLQMHPTALGPSIDYFNAYSLVQSKGVYRGQKNEDPNKRVFILTRSAYAGQQRYSAATWSGDVVSTWADLHDQISAGLNFSLSGIPYWTSDIGGFSVRKRYEDATGEDLAEWRELNTRWFQFGAFCPLFRVHGQYPYREMFNIAPQDHLAYQSMLYYDRLRYRLMPYIYSLAGLTYHKDYTIMRALIMDFPEDTKVYDIVDQYMFGPNIMVNPVCEYKARSRKVYLPAGTGWFNLHTGEYYQGGQEIEAKAPLQHIPLFVKEGSIIPAGPEIKYTDQKPANPVTLWIYTGADAHFTLYEDENVNINYKKGKFSVIPINYNETGQSLIIGKRKGKFDGMLQERIFKIIWIDPDDPQRLDFSAAVDEELNYKGKEIIIKRNPQN